MNTTTQQPQFESLPPRGANLCLLYSDLGTGTRAKRFADALVNETGVEARLTLWRYEMLELETLAAAAAFEADGCDFMILSLAGDAHLPHAVKRWLECWLETAAARGACLVALFDPERGVPLHVESIRHYLRGVAESARVAFFAHCALFAGTSDRAQARKKSHPSFSTQQALAALAA